MQAPALFLLTFVCIVNASSPTEPNTKLTKLTKCLAESGVDVTSSLVLRSDTSKQYTDLNFQWNKCCGMKYPLGYLLARDVADVQSAVICAGRVQGVRIVPKGGGYSYGKHSFGDNDTLVVDFRNMNKIEVDAKAKTGVIQPGALLGPIMWTLWNNGKFGLPYGACLPVGVSFVLGGGYGELSRLHGMTVDSLLELDMIDAAGKLLKINKQENPDLFWALRGGGAGSFGIVTRFKFKLFNAPASIVQGNNAYTFEEFPAVFKAWQSFVASNPPNTIQALIRILPRNPPFISLKVIDLQNTADSSTVGQSRVQKILSSSFPKPSTPSTIQSWPFLQFMMVAGNEDTGYNVNLTHISQMQHVKRGDFAPKNTLMSKTIYVPIVIPQEDVMKVFKMLQKKPASIVIILRALGGAINNVDPKDTAFVHRSPNLYSMDIQYIGLKENTELALPWMRKFFDNTKSIFKHTESYQNHLDVELVDYVERYYGANAPRLREIKRKVDPDNFFHNPQSISA